MFLYKSLSSKVQSTGLTMLKKTTWHTNEFNNYHNHTWKQGQGHKPYISGHSLFKPHQNILLLWPSCLFTFTSLRCVLFKFLWTSKSCPSWKLLLQFNISNLDFFPILKVTSFFFPEVRTNLGFQLTSILIWL